jgi:hypothetical protein
MDYVGIAVPKNQSQISSFDRCTAAGEVLHQHFHTQRERFAAVLMGASASRPAGGSSR